MRAMLLAFAFASTASASVTTYQDRASSALVRGESARALAAADRGLDRHPGDGMLLYDRGSALAALGRTDEAVASLDAATRAFAADPHWQALATYRAFLALEQAGRCREARAWLARYLPLASPEDQTMALNVGQACPLPGYAAIKGGRR